MLVPTEIHGFMDFWYHSISICQRVFLVLLQQLFTLHSSAWCSSTVMRDAHPLLYNAATYVHSLSIRQTCTASFPEPSRKASEVFWKYKTTKAGHRVALLTWLPPLGVPVHVWHTPHRLGPTVPGRPLQMPHRWSPKKTTQNFCCKQKKSYVRNNSWCEWPFLHCLQNFGPQHEIYCRMPYYHCIKLLQLALTAARQKTFAALHTYHLGLNKSLTIVMLQKLMH